MNVLIELSAAIESLLILLVSAVVVSILGILICYFSQRIPILKNWKFIKRKLLLIPSVLFVSTLIIFPLIQPLPITPYKGPNQIRNDTYVQDNPAITIYDNIAYENTVALHASAALGTNQSVVVQADIIQNELTVTTIELKLTNHNPEGEQIHGVKYSNISPGNYIINFATNFYTNDIPTDDGYVAILFCQEMSDEHILELENWGSANFIMVMVSFVFILTGICYDTGKVHEKEPPKEKATIRTYDIE